MPIALPVIKVARATAPSTRSTTIGRPSGLPKMGDLPDGLGGDGGDVLMNGSQWGKRRGLPEQSAGGSVNRKRVV